MFCLKFCNRSLLSLLLRTRQAQLYCNPSGSHWSIWYETISVLIRIDPTRLMGLMCKENSHSYWKKSVLRRIEYAYFVISSKYIVNANLHANSNACKICTIYIYVHIYMTTLVSGVEFDFYTNIQISLQCFLIESIQDYMWITTLVLIPLQTTTRKIWYIKNHLKEH